MTVRTLDDVTVDLEAGRARGPRGEVRLSAREAALLGALLHAEGRPVDRDALADAIGVDTARAVDFAVRRLRGKLERDPGDPRLVLAVHGQGYRVALGGAAVAPAPAPAQLLAIGERRIDLAIGTVTLLGDEVALSAVQRIVLEALVEAAGHWVPRDALARALRGSGRRTSVERVVSGLRSLVEPVPAEPVHLLREGDGYRLVLKRPTHDLPAPQPLLGRDAELAALRAAATAPGWIEIVGPVGAGKTLLAHHLALDLAEALPGGAWWVDGRAAQTAPDLVRAAALALRSDGAGGLAGLVATLRSRGPTLLVLDGIDDVDGAAALVEELVARRVEARIVTTGSRALGASGPTLRLGGLPPPHGRALYRRAAGERGFDGGADAAIDVLVERLDGLPLAIELAARYAAALPSERLAEGDVVEALEAFAGPTPLRSALEGAWRAADAEGRRALVELSCFRGPFSAEDAAAVADVREDTLRALVGRSLLAEDRGGYRLLAVLRPVLGPPAADTRARYERRLVGHARSWGEDPPHRVEVLRGSADLLAVGTALAAERPGEAAVVAHALACCQHRPTPAVRALVESLLASAPTPELWLDTFQWRRLEGDLDGAEAAVAAAEAIGQDPQSWHARYARILLGVDRQGIGRVDLGPEPDGALPRARWQMVRGRALAYGGELLRGYGLLVRARELCRERGFALASLAAERHLAEVLALLGAPSDLVARRLERALVGLEAVGAWTSVPPCALAAAVHRSSVGRLSQAAALVERARRVAAELDLPREESRARGVMLRLGAADLAPDALVLQALDAGALARSLDHGIGAAVARFVEAVARARGGDRDEALALAVDPTGADPVLQIGFAALAALLDPDRPVPAPPPQRHWVRSAALVAAHVRGAELRDRHARRDAASNPIVRALVAVGRR